MAEIGAFLSEKNPLISKKDNYIPINGFNPPAQAVHSLRRAIFLTIGVFFVVASVLSVKLLNNADLFGSDSKDDDTLIVSNEFERSYGRVIGDGVYPYEKLVAVHKLTTLKLSSNENAKWIIVTPKKINSDLSTTDQYKVDLGESHSIKYTFTAVGRYEVIVIRKDNGVKKVYSVDSRIVRYELRDLNAEDRTTYFETLQKFYSISDEDGYRIYGPYFVSWAALVRVHLTGSANKECDSFHDGAGMLNHHIGMTMVFEQSLRMINPTVAAHYWDYTREFMDHVEWHDTGMFQAEWFGTVSPANEDQIVDEGRWAYLSLLSNAQDFSEIVNPYGLLRSPWNTNPVPYLTRYNKSLSVVGHYYTHFPTCGMFALNLGSSYADVSDSVNSELHGPIRTMVGGYYNHQAILNRKIASEYDPIYGENHLLTSKTMWREGWIRTPESCSEDTPANECLPSCPNEVIGDMTARTALQKSGALENTINWYNTYKNAIFIDDSPDHSSNTKKVAYGDTTTKSKSSAKTAEEEEEEGDEWLSYQSLLDELCLIGYSGEAFSSSAPQDPIIWSLHGNIERLLYALQYYRKIDKTDFDISWGYTHDSTNSKFNLLCDWSEVNDITDMPKCEFKTCPGHTEHGLLPFRNLHFVDGIASQFYTNSEFFNIIQLDNGNLPYVYDSIIYWKACKGQNLVTEAGAFHAFKSHTTVTGHSEDRTYPF